MSAIGPGIKLFANYAESEGGLAELRPDSALVVLPEQLRTELSVPEELVVTEDPEVAREDGLVLVAPGHPLLTAAARSVLERGDVGSASLARTIGLPPARAVLEAKAREQIPVDHGRLDLGDAPRTASLTVVRAAALITYAISIDERIQEVEEVWVDAVTCHEVPGRLRDILCSATLELSMTRQLAMPPSACLAAVDALFEVRARIRGGVLERETSLRLEQQLKILDDYYERVLASLEDRRSRAVEHRAEILAAQFEATKADWSRRRAEVAEELTPTVDIHPFRLHVLEVPVYEVEAVVRRGNRQYELPLIYVQPTASFLVPSCPCCASCAPLVAAKDRLGCRSCLAVATEPERPRTPDTIPEPTPVLTSLRPADRETRLGAKPPRPKPRTKASGKSTGRVTPKGTRPSSTLNKTGLGLAVSFWSAVQSGHLGRRTSMKIVHGSPMEALVRLYGPRGPALVVGIEDLDHPEGVAVATTEEREGIVLTAGELELEEDREVPFALFWRQSSGALLEIEAFPLERTGQVLTRHDAFAGALREHLAMFLEPAPAPVEELAPVPAALLGRACVFLGLGYAARCLAAWWYLSEGDGAQQALLEAHDLAVAAAIESVVLKRIRITVPATALAGRYGCSPEDVRRLARKFHGEVADVSGLCW